MRELVTYEWCARTGGTLTREQKRYLLRRTIASYGDHARGLVRLATGRRAGVDLVLPTVPDSALVDAALEVGRDQGPELEGHGFRTWLFGAVLAESDGVRVDPELLCIGGILHDAGAAEAVAGQDFTVRSADTAVLAFEKAGRPLDDARAAQLRDGIVAHATAGVTPEESALGTYIQAGAMLDIAGVRLADLSSSLVKEIFARHPNTGVHAVILRLIEAEAKAVPDGRFAHLRKLGLGLAAATSPTRRGG